MNGEGEGHPRIAKDCRLKSLGVKALSSVSGLRSFPTVFVGKVSFLRLQYPRPHPNVDNRRYREFPNCTGGKMSITSFNGGQPLGAQPTGTQEKTIRPKVTTTTIHDKKQRHEPITCLTAYDYATARLVDEAGIDMILVGDSPAQVVLGYDNTLPVTMEEMIHHTRAARPARKSAILITPIP